MRIVCYIAALEKLLLEMCIPAQQLGGEFREQGQQTFSNSLQWRIIGEVELVWNW